MVWNRDWFTHSGAMQSWAEFQLIFLFATLGTCLKFLCLFHSLRKRIKWYGIDYGPRSCPLPLDPHGTGSPLPLISKTVLTSLAVVLMFPFSFPQKTQLWKVLNQKKLLWDALEQKKPVSSFVLWPSRLWGLSQLHIKRVSMVKYGHIETLYSPSLRSTPNL